MEALHAAKLLGIRALVALLLVVGAAATAVIGFVKKLPAPTEFVDGVRNRQVLWPWLTQSYKLVLGTIAYNAFVFLVVEPILRRWFPPLKPWEHVTGFFAGSTRTTYEDVVPAIATILWIAGNALVITLLNRRLQVARDVE